MDKPQYRSDRTKKIHSDCQFKSNYSEPVLPIFEPSGLLELESHGKEGIQLKHVEPKDAQSPLDYYRNSAVPVRKRTRYEAIIYTIGEEHPVKEYELWDKSSYLIGRNLGRSTRKYEQAEATEEEKEVVLADISIPEETCSKQHCVIQFRIRNNLLVPYIIDLNSSNGTLLNDAPLPAARYVELRSGDTLKFSTLDEAQHELVFMAV